MAKPRLFIGSSSDNKDLAYAAQEGLEAVVEATVWDQDVFTLSRSGMEALLDRLDNSDFGLFVFSPSDTTTIKASAKRTVRDNVVFELGLFAGRLGIERCFMIVPRGVEDLHLPTDLLGLTAGYFDADRQDGNMVAALGPACNRIRRLVSQLGPYKPAGSPATLDELPKAEGEPQSDLLSDENDIISAIQSWMGQRPMHENTQAIRYRDVDATLGLVPGSAEKYIEIAAKKWDYITERKGKDTILFQDAPHGSRWVV